MIYLYLDFDGVILDTITISNNYLKDNNITKEEDIHNYFENLDWRDLMSRSSIINNAIDNIWKLYESRLFKIGIITHYNSIQEIMLKDKFITDNLPNDIVVHYVHHSNKKNSKVDAYNAVLDILTDEAKDYLIEVYGDLTSYLTTKIEAEVNLNK